ncbi:MAG: ATP-binding cassette domain-containing protein [Erysipelotrichales bacterium]|nr:ATP-binding cassette domain-containing protein [Erysipelotrichales bacterium]
MKEIEDLGSSDDYEETDKKQVLVSFQHVKISFKHGIYERVIIDDLNLDIYKGEILGLVGESGSGKTTIGRGLIRIIPISGGQILYGPKKKVISGKISNERARNLKTKIQMIFQDPSASLNDRSNVDYIISEGLRAFHLYKNETERLQKVEKMIKRVGLSVEHLKRYPHEFSGGQRQRIGIARCMIMDPEMIIADEPISALDVSIRAQVLNLIKEFRDERGLTVLFIAHDLSVVKYISDRIAVIFQGRLVELCSAERLFEMPLHPYTKSLLSAIPLPDPHIEKKKTAIIYNPSEHNYTADDPADFYEVEENHFVRCNLEELKKYQAIIKNAKEGAENE